MSYPRHLVGAGQAASTASATATCTVASETSEWMPCRAFLLLGVIWAAVLLPPWLQSRREARPIASMMYVPQPAVVAAAGAARLRPGLHRLRTAATTTTATRRRGRRGRTAADGRERRRSAGGAAVVPGRPPWRRRAGAATLVGAPPRSVRVRSRAAAPAARRSYRRRRHILSALAGPGRCGSVAPAVLLGGAWWIAAAVSPAALLVDLPGAAGPAAASRGRAAPEGALPHADPGTAPGGGRHRQRRRPLARRRHDVSTRRRARGPPRHAWPRAIAAIDDDAGRRQPGPRAGAAGLPRGRSGRPGRASGRSTGWTPTPRRRWPTAPRRRCARRRRVLAPFPAVGHAGFLHDAEKEYIEARAVAAAGRRRPGADARRSCVSARRPGCEAWPRRPASCGATCSTGCGRATWSAASRCWRPWTRSTTRSSSSTTPTRVDQRTAPDARRVAGGARAQPRRCHHDSSPDPPPAGHRGAFAARLRRERAGPAGGPSTSGPSRKSSWRLAGQIRRWTVLVVAAATAASSSCVLASNESDTAIHPRTSRAPTRRGRGRRRRRSRRRVTSRRAW